MQDVADFERNELYTCIIFTHHGRESTEERIPEMTQCEGKVLVEEILEEFTHA